MISKKNRPHIELKGWLNVEGADCVITDVYGSYSLLGACEVVTNPEKPVNREVCWNGQEWVFSKRPTFVNAAKTSRLKDFVGILQEQNNLNDCKVEERSA